MFLYKNTGSWALQKYSDIFLRQFASIGLSIFVNARVYFGDAVVSTSLIKCLFVAHWCKHRFALTSTLSRLFAIGFTKIVFQQNRFSWSYSYRIIILGTIPYSLLPKAVFWRSCQRQLQERYEVARVKTDTLDRRERGSMNSSKNIEIYLVRLSDEGWEQEKWIRQEPSNPYLNGLWISHLSGDA